MGDSRAAEFLKKSEELKNRVNEYYWNAEKGAYIDSYKSGNANVTRHANIFAVMYDIASEEQAQSILNNVLRNDAVIKIRTPYFAGYELDALATKYSVNFILTCSSDYESLPDFVKKHL